MGNSKTGLKEKEVNELIHGVFIGFISVASLPLKLPKKLYHGIANKLKAGLYEGYGGSLNSYEFGGTDYKLLAELRNNIYMFSGAKTFNQVLEMSEALTEGGKLVPFSEFKKRARDIFDLHNEHYLQTEYDTAIGQAQSAQKWNDIIKTKEEFPYLRRSAVMDKRTSPECRVLNNVTAPVDDPFWSTRSPLSHFRCRCIIQKYDKYEHVNVTPQKEIEKAVKETEHLQPMFKSNPGKSGEVFNKDHPYFAVPKKYAKLAKRNFDLPIPEND